MKAKMDLRRLNAAKAEYYADYEKRLNDAIVAAYWGESQDGELYREVDDSGFNFKK